MFRRLTASIVLIAGLAAAAAPAVAQANLTEDEIARRFQGQVTEIGRTRSIAAPPAERHRGLSLAPSATLANPSATAPTQVNVVPVEYTPATVENQVNIQISFDLDSAFIRDDQKPKLVSLCNVMKAVSIPQFRIIGHTDASGNAEYNDNLSVLRAEAVRRHLVDDCGIPADRLLAVGVGERYPANSGNPNADENRRVEFQALG